MYLVYCNFGYPSFITIIKLFVHANKTWERTHEASRRDWAHLCNSLEPCWHAQTGVQANQRRGATCNKLHRPATFRLTFVCWRRPLVVRLRCQAMLVGPCYFPSREVPRPVSVWLECGGYGELWPWLAWYANARKSLLFFPPAWQV